MSKLKVFRCLGEGIDLFTISEENDRCAFLLDLRGLAHGWENKTKLTEVSSKEVEDRLEFHREMVAGLEKVLGV
jgi:hypothetical protein